MKESELKISLRTEGLIVAAILLVGFLPGLIDAGVFEVFSWHYWDADERVATKKSELVRNLGLLAVGVIGLAFGIWRAYTAYLQTRTAQVQARIAEQGQVTDRFAKAIELLGTDKATIRTGAVYALGRIARDSIQFDHIAVMQVLSQFICNSPYAEEQEGVADDYARRLAEFEEKYRGESEEDGPFCPKVRKCPDILAAFDVITTRSDEQKAWEEKNEFDLSLDGARLLWLDLSNAKLRQTFINNADFRGANLQGVDFRNASLSKTDFREANLEEARLDEADLSGANLTAANMINAHCRGTYIHAADLIGTKLGAAYLVDADLSETRIHGADLRSANLIRANLTGANLSGAKNLTQRQIESACADPIRPPVRLPKDKDGKQLIWRGKPCAEK